MLTVHSVAALRGWRGPARNDERARRIVRLLTSGPAYHTGTVPPWPDPMFHSPGWVGNVAGPYSTMDKAIDPKIAEGLRLAWEARAVLGLDDATVALVAAETEAVARTPFFRFPAVRLNQINWPAELYAHEAVVTGTPDLLVGDYRAHVRSFLDGARAGRNLGPSLRFHYLPGRPPGSRVNVDSAEYANMTLHFLAWYDEALGAGMAPLPRADVRLLRRWVERALFGYWTHSGALSWDTGLGFRRWMKTKTWAFSLQGLLAMAEAGPFQRDPRYGAWAKAMFDRSLDLYERLEEGPERGIPAAGMFGVDQSRRDVPDGRLIAARMGANAVRALTAGLGRMASEEPPAFYAFDRDVGRLAVSTPAYSTAVVAVNRGAFPYGGNELARLHDRDGDVIGGIGGRVPAAFGVVVRDRAGRRVLATQVGRDDAASPPVALRAWPRTGRNGPFRVLRTSAVRRARGVVATTRHTFRASSIVQSWTVRSSRRPVTVSALFPSWGDDARVEATLHDGRVVSVGDPVDLATVRDFVVRSSAGAYRVTPVGTVPGRARVVAVRRQPSAPLAGPSLELRLPRSVKRRAASPPADRSKSSHRPLTPSHRPTVGSRAVLLRGAAGDKGSRACSVHGPRAGWSRVR